MGDFERIIYQPARVARIILNRPEVKNAQDRLLLGELDEAFHRAGADPQVRVIVLSGEGRDFSAGHDIKQMANAGPSEQPLNELDTALSRYERTRVTYAEDHLSWRNIPKPTIAMVQGYCIFGGWMIASTMDVVFAAEDALFLPLPYPADYWAVTWELGAKKTKELLYEHRFLTATEAMEAGFVSRVYPLEDLERETLAYAERVAERDPIQLRDLKMIINETLDGMGFSASVHLAFNKGATRQRAAPASAGTGDYHESPYRRLVQDALRRFRPSGQ